MNILNFNDTLTNDIVSFEQPGPGLFWLFPVIKSVPVKFTQPYLAVTLIFCSDVLLDEAKCAISFSSIYVFARVPGRATRYMYHHHHQIFY